MKKVIKVVVDLALRNLNKEFDYLLPEEFESKIKVGQIIKVPFGRRKIFAFVTGIDVHSEVESSKLKEINSIVYKQSFFDKNLLKLFYWISNYYHAFLAQVIKTALPAGITNKKIKKKKVEYLKLSNSEKKYNRELKRLKNRAPKQYLILKYIVENQNQELELKKVLEYADTSKATVRRLIEKDLIIMYTDIRERRAEIENKFKLPDKEISLRKREINYINNLTAGEYTQTKYVIESGARRYTFVIELLKKLISADKNIILLIPEIQKDYIFLEQIRNVFADEQIAFLHSKLKKGERFDEWQRIMAGRVNLVIGARSAVFAPFAELDAVIIMEENNENYKQQEHPLYHVRQLAAKRLENKNSLLILESPTPSVESKSLVQNEKYSSFELKDKKDKKNYNIVDMKKEIEDGNLGDLSRELKNEIKKQLQKNNKIMLFLNRRGAANYVICRKCGEVIKCENCNISLNYHKTDDKLRCHYCSFERDMPELCPECGSKFISQAGIGIEKVLKEIKENFPQAAAEKVDGELTVEEVDEKLKSFKNGEIDILIGTSILIKNQFYENLNFLAVISADTALNSSDFRAAEKNYALLKQLSSLVKNNKNSKIYFQTYKPEHYSLQSLINNEPQEFYKKELAIRKTRNYPPFSRLLNIIVRGQKEAEVKKAALKLSNFLDNYSDKFSEKLEAAPAALNKIRNKHRWQLLIKFKNTRSREYVIQLIEKIFMQNNNVEEIEIRIDVDPYQML